ncbi:MAG: DUF58 domain-containing protein [Lachnospiraceae bacterium]|nr:DUF58 domain-containing protein [Lachnospiraceae bacterium]
MEIFILIGILLAIFIVEIIYYRKHALDNLHLKVDFSKNVANCGEDIELIEVAENRKRLPLPFIILKFEAPRELRFYDMMNTSTSDLLYREDMLTMKAFSKHTRRIKAQCSKRGYYVFPRVGITTSDLLLTERFTKDFPNDSHLVVLPEILNAGIIQMLTSVTLSDLQCRRTLLTDPFTLSGIREYGPDDPMKSINWKASARTGELMVNQKASTCTQKVHIFLNLDYYNQKRSTSLLERSISLAYTYLIQLAELGIPASIYTNGLDVITDMPVISETDLGSASLDERAVMLARIDLKKHSEPFAGTLEKYIPSTDRDDFILVISPQFNGSFRPVLADVKSRRPSLRWLMPCYKTTPDADPEPLIADSYIRWEIIGND